jgi:hypothetical protein
MDPPGLERTQKAIRHGFDALFRREIFIPEAKVRLLCLLAPDDRPGPHPAVSICGLTSYFHPLILARRGMGRMTPEIVRVQ